MNNDVSSQYNNSIKMTIVNYH